MNKEFVNWGVLGCAIVAGSDTIPAMKNADNAKLYAIAGTRPEKLARYKNKFNPVKTYSSYDELLDDKDIDAVYIALMNSMHKEWVIKAAEKKKHILCEKPLGLTAAEVSSMREAAGKNNVLLMEAYANRQSPVTLKVKELIDNGTIGKIKMMESYFTFPFYDMNDYKFHHEMGGGSLYDVGCYNINLMRYLADGEPVSILAAGEIEQERNVDISCTGILEFKDGLKGVFYSSFNVLDRQGYRIIGETGVIDVPYCHNAKGKVKIHIQREKEELILTIDTPDNYMLEFEQFGRCILNGEKPRISLEDSYNNALVMDKIFSIILK